MNVTKNLFNFISKVKSSKSELNKLPKQKIALAIGKDGCYFCCLVKIAELYTNKNIDIIEAFNYCNNQRKSNTQWISDSCYIYYPEEILNYLTGKKSSLLKTINTYFDTSIYDYVIGCFKSATGNHFVLLNRDNMVIYDPLGDSNTIKTGTLSSYRLVNIIDN